MSTPFTPKQIKIIALALKISWSLIVLTIIWILVLSGRDDSGYSGVAQLFALGGLIPFAVILTIVRGAISIRDRKKDTNTKEKDPLKFVHTHRTWLIATWALVAIVQTVKHLYIIEFQGRELNGIVNVFLFGPMYFLGALIIGYSSIMLWRQNSYRVFALIALPLLLILLVASNELIRSHCETATC